MSPPPSMSLYAMLRGLTSWTLVVLMGGLGLILVGIGLGEELSPPHPVHSALPAPQPLVARPVQQMTAVRTSVGTMGRGSWRVVGDRADAEEEPNAAVCLGADLAEGRRGESAHQATVTLPQPGACGDVREALAGMAQAALERPQLISDFGANSGATTVVGQTDQSPR